MYDLHNQLAGLDLFISIGPEASRYLYAEFPERSEDIIFTMVYNAANVLKQQNNVCGVSLNIPIENQIQTVKRTFPEIRRIGILHNPEQNGDFVKSAIQVAGRYDISLISMPVEDRKEIPLVLNQHWHHIEILWMIPDYTVISESLVKYIIKTALTNNTGVLGYNRFFHDRGAVLSLILNCYEIGRQTAELVEYKTNRQMCPVKVPAFQTWVNQKAAESLKLKVVWGEEQDIIAGP